MHFKTNQALINVQSLKMKRLYFHKYLPLNTKNIRAASPKFDQQNFARYKWVLHKEFYS